MAATELASPATSQCDETMTDAIQSQHHDGTDKDIPAPTPAENPGERATGGGEVGEEEIGLRDREGGMDELQGENPDAMLDHQR